MTNVVLPVLVLKHPPPNLKQGDKPMTDMCWADQRKLAEDWWQPPYLLLGFKDITPEDIAGTISRDIAEDLQVLGIMRDVEDPRGKKKTTTEKHTKCGIQSRVSTGNLWSWRGRRQSSLVPSHQRKSFSCGIKKPLCRRLFPQALQTWLLGGGTSRFGRAGVVGCGNHIIIDYILRWQTCFW